MLSLELLEQVRDFLESGGYVLWSIFVVACLLWTLIIERYWYLRLVHPRYLRRMVKDWRARGDMLSWHARKIRQANISVVFLRLSRSLFLIKALIGLCPLLGLLGTVTGMIRVFDVMGILGAGNARAMAAGVSMATLPTMAGMAVALSGLFFSARLQQHAALESQRAADLLRDYGGESV